MATTNLQISVATRLSLTFRTPMVPVQCYQDPNRPYLLDMWFMADRTMTQADMDMLQCTGNHPIGQPFPDDAPNGNYRYWYIGDGDDGFAASLIDDRTFRVWVRSLDDSDELIRENRDNPKPPIQW